MNWLTRVFLTALLVLGHPAPADEPSRTPLALDETAVKRLTLEKNQHVLAAQERVRSTEARTGHLVRSFLPRIELRGGAERFQTGFYSTLSQPFGSIAAELNLFRGGRDSLEEDVRSAEVRESEAEAEGDIQEELTKARRAFWSLVYQREVIRFLLDAQERNQASLTSANRKIGAGMGSETDRLEFEIHKTNLEQDLARAQLDERNLKRDLGVLLGLPEGTELETPQDIPHAHEDELLTRRFDVERHREIRGLEARSSASLQASRREARWWTPSLDVFGGYWLFTFREREYAFRNDRVDTAVGVQLSFSLFDGGVARSEAISLRRQADSTELRTAQSRRELRARLQGTQDELKLLHDLVHGAERTVDQATAYLRGTQSEYNRGVKNSPDVLGANEKYLEAQRRWADIRRDFQFARTEMMSLLNQ